MLKTKVIDIQSVNMNKAYHSGYSFAHRTFQHNCSGDDKGMQYFKDHLHKYHDKYESYEYDSFCAGFMGSQNAVKNAAKTNAQNTPQNTNFLSFVLPPYKDIYPNGPGSSDRQFKDGTAYIRGYGYCGYHFNDGMEALKGYLRYSYANYTQEKYKQFCKGYLAKAKEIKNDKNYTIGFPSYEEIYPQGPKISDEQQVNDRSRIYTMGYRFEDRQSSTSLDIEKFKTYIIGRSDLITREKYNIFCSGVLAKAQKKENNANYKIDFPSYEEIFPNGPKKNDQQSIIDDAIEASQKSRAYVWGYNLVRGRKASLTVEDLKAYMLQKHPSLTSVEYESFCRGFIAELKKSNPTHSIDLPSYETVYPNGPAPMTSDQDDIVNGDREAYLSAYAAVRSAERDKLASCAVAFLQINRKEYYTQTQYDDFCYAYMVAAISKFGLRPNEINEVKFPPYENVFNNNNNNNNNNNVNNNNNNDNNRPGTANTLLLLADAAFAAMYATNQNGMDDYQGNEEGENNRNKKKQKTEGPLN